MFFPSAGILHFAGSGRTLRRLIHRKSGAKRDGLREKQNSQCFNDFGESSGAWNIRSPINTGGAPYITGADIRSLLSKAAVTIASI